MCCYFHVSDASTITRCQLRFSSKMTNVCLVWIFALCDLQFCSWPKNVQNAPSLALLCPCFYRGASHKRNRSCPQGRQRTLGILLLWSPREALFLTSEVPCTLLSEVGMRDPRDYLMPKLSLFKKKIPSQWWGSQNGPFLFRE